ncbi:MAG TPA: asparagine synthase-related protein [Xanthobacteraceae bacterium]|jgi:asparagine synthase (glutamine-hydrolysing)
MTEFAGIVTFDRDRGEIQSEEQIGRAVALAGKGKAAARRIDGALFVQQTGNGDTLPMQGSVRNLFAANARLDNRSELGEALAITPPDLAATPDGALILRMFERWGEAGIARCLGAFAFALWDTSARRLILGRDCLGNRALFFHRGDGFVAFATTLRTMLAMACVPRAIDEMTLADILAVNLHEPHRTVYRGIDRVPSRSLVIFDTAATDCRHYWSPNFDARPPYRREQDYIERARELLDQAVADATRDTAHVAIWTSGGLDSSAIAATVARIGAAQRITCYTLVPPPDLDIELEANRYLDESDKVEALARMHPALDVRLFAPESTHPDMADDTRYFARANAPALNPDNHADFSYLYHGMAAAGHSAFLYGRSGNFGLSWPGSLSLISLLNSGRWWNFTRELRASARESDRGLMKTFAGEVVAPAAPVWLRRLVHRLKRRDPDSVAGYSALNPTYFRDHDLTRRWRGQGFDPQRVMRGRDPAHYRARRLFDHNQPGRDFYAMTRAMYGCETCDPLGDRRLLEFLLTVPEPMYRRNGVPRAFARAVLADRLPPEILHERRRGEQAANWFRQMNARRHDIAAEIDRLQLSASASRMIDLSRLKRSISEWPTDEHAAQKREIEFKHVLSRSVHVGRFIRWVEGGNA